MTFFQEIKEALIKGEDFNNESADWATQNCGLVTLLFFTKILLLMLKELNS